MNTAPLLFEMTPSYCLYLFVTLSAIIFLRYILFSGLYHYLFYHLLGERYKKRVINSHEIDWQQSKTDILRSLYTSLIFAALSVLLFYLWHIGIIDIYMSNAKYPWWWMPLSLCIALFVQETYYYWLHRWMHLPAIYKVVHRWHHDSIATNSLTAFSFHPIESFMQAIIILVILIVLPMHFVVLLLFLLIMTVSATINHAGIEVYPKWFHKIGLTKMLIGSSHHDVHHKNMRYHFGLYFTFWDRVMGTEMPKFDKVIEEIY